MLVNDLTYNIDFINPRHKNDVYRALVATGLALGSVFIRWEPVKIVGLTVLTGAIYGIANDMFACRDCIEYFTNNHRSDGRELERRILRTLNPTLNAIVWGMIATWDVCVIAGVVLALAARAPCPGLALKISAAQLAPYLAIGAALTIIIAHIKSRLAQKKMAENPHLKYPGVPLDLQAGWEACNLRNLTGYTAIGLGGIALSIAIIVARVGLIRL